MVWMGKYCSAWGCCLGVYAKAGRLLQNHRFTEGDLEPMKPVSRTRPAAYSLLAAACLLAATSAGTLQAQTTLSPQQAGAAMPAAAQAAATVAPPAGGHLGTWGFDLTGRDLATKPGDDFYKFANGAWEQRTQIPADASRYGSFDALRDLSEERMRDILQDAAAGKVQDADAAKLAAAWRSFMDEGVVDALDAAPLLPSLDAVRAAKTLEDMTALMGHSHLGGGFDAVFGIAVQDDAKQPDRYAVHLGTGGLGLPDRDYYLKDSFAAKKAAYEAYVRQLLEMVQWPDAAAAAKEVVAFETRIAEVTWERAQRRDRDKTYHAMTLPELQAYAPGLDWSALLAQAGLKAPTKLILTTDTAFPKLAAIYHDTPLATLRAWQAFHVVDNGAPYLSARFDKAHFAFRSGTLAGQPEQKARWKRAAAFANGAIGESLGRVYVARYFPASSKATMQQLVGNLRESLSRRIDSKLDWMSPATKLQAQQKLAKFTVKIGYPDSWRDYGALQLRDGDLYGNVQRAKAFDWNRRVARLNQPVDKAEWGMTPQTVNAYYNSVKNEIVFPAAILQPPFFDPQADPAVNYGGIVAVIGHEVGHGFDDQGRKSDGNGALRDWWTAEDAAKFKLQADKLGKQYDSYEPLPGAHVIGALTMGENIGDLGGLTMAYDAYMISLKGQPAPVIDGLTGQQRFFLGFAQLWRTKTRDEALRRQLVSDPHSPGYYRANGVVRNMDAWYEAFGVKEGDKLYLAPAERVRIW
jgi:putative endopeptidase